MADINKTDLWANLETQVAEPPGSLQDSGYAPLEQPFNEHHNWLWNSRDKIQHQLVQERNYKQHMASGILITDQCAQRFYNRDWLHPYSAVNTYTFLSGNQPHCMCPGWDYSRNRPCIFVGLMDEDGVYRVFNEDGGGIGAEFINLGFLNTSLEYPEALVCEGDALYVMTFGNPSGNMYFYRFPMNPFSSTPTWSTSHTGSNFKTGLGENAMCIAGDWLVYLLSNLPLGNNTIRFIRKSDAGAFQQGEGNGLALGSNYQVTPSLVSNGTEVFFQATDNTATFHNYLCGCDVSNPANATTPLGAWTAKVLNGTIIGRGGDLIYDGHLVHCLSANGHVGSYNWHRNVWPLLNDAMWQYASAKITAGPTRQNHANFAFDGFYGWALLEFDGEDADNQAFISPCRLGDTAIDYNTSNIPIALQAPWPEIMLGEPKSADPVNYLTKMIYSDNCLWIIPRIKTAPVGTTLLRLPDIRSRR